MIETRIMVEGCSRLIKAFWVYGALVYEDSRKVWEYIKRKVIRSEGPLMCIGDFNDIICDEEKDGVNSYFLNEVHFQG